MSESSSDSESSCGWTIISAEGSDIETLGPEHEDESQLHQEEDREEEGLLQRVEPCEGEGRQQREEPREREELQQRVEPCEGEGLQQRVEPCEGDGLQQREEPREGEELQQRVQPHKEEGLHLRVEPCEEEGQQQRVEPCEGEGQQQRVEPCEVEGLHVEEEPQESSLLQAELHSGSWAESTLDNSIKDEKSGKMEAVSEAATEPVTLCSTSDHSSDIVTLELSMETEPGASWEEPQGVLGEELYMGTSSSSQYAFSASESTPSLSVEHTVGDGSSSSGEEQEPCPALRRRRGRRGISSLSETQEGRGSELEEQPQDQQPDQQLDQQLDQQGEQQAPFLSSRGGGALNKCILLGLVIAVSMSFGHFYGTVQTQERQRLADKVHWNEISKCQRERDVMSQGKEVVEQMRAKLEEKQAMVLSLTQIMDKISKENHQLRLRQSEQQALRRDLSERRQQSSLEKSELETQHKHLASGKRRALSSLEHEEQSLTALQGELLSLRAQVRSLEESGAGADSLLSQNRALKEQMDEERRLVEQFLSQKEALEAQAQVLQEQLGRERSETERLREELEQLKGRSAGGADPETDPETQELHIRLAELERKLSFEQQRSDLWERLYVETKQDRAKGDQQPRPKRPREGIINKVKETFDAVKNSTKEFVHHHKEQIKKAKEAVKENLRKFSDSVKSTFRHFKDSASRVFEKARRPRDRKFQEKRDAKSARHEHQQEHARESRQERDSDRSSGQPRSHKPLHEKPHKPAARTSRGEQNTRKPGPSSRKDSNRHRKTLKGCSGVFDCAYQESMTLFNKALEPIRADEFNQLIRSYVQQEVDHFHHWRELESFINGFFHNGVFIHDQMLFSDFVSVVEDYLEDMDEYQQHSDDVFEDLDDYVYKHFFGDNYLKQYGPSRVIAKPASVRKQGGPSRPQWQHHPHFHPHRERKWSKPGCCTGRHMGRPTGGHLADVKIEFGPIPLDPKY